MNLTGTFPLELPQLLPELRVLSLTANDLYGELPASAPEWKRLRSLNLHRNLFTGNIPSEWLDSRMEKLELLGLAYNPLTIGSLPPEIGTLTDLKYLFLEETHVSGTIPEELYQLTNLGKHNCKWVYGFQCIEPTELMPISVCFPVFLHRTNPSCEKLFDGYTSNRDGFTVQL